MTRNFSSAAKRRSVSTIPNFAVIIRCLHERGEAQAEALREMDKRRLWLSDEQRITASLEEPKPC